jgi:tetratricopeptide (TPR) repeat protein
MDKIKKITNLALKNGNYKFGISEVKNYFKENNDNEDAIYFLGILYDHLAQVQKIFFNKLYFHYKAMILYKKVLILNPESKKGLMGVGRIYWHKNNSKKSLYYYHKALSCHPNDAEILNSIANAYKINYNYNKAIKYYQRAIDTSKASHGTFFNFAKLLIEMNRKQEARTIFNLGKKMIDSNKLSNMEIEIINNLANLLNI